MRILHVGKYYAPVKGGMETALRLICEGLLAAGHEVTALVAGGGLRGGEELLVAGPGTGRGRLVRLPTWGAWQSQPLLPTLVTALRRELAASPPDVVHLHLPNPAACLAWRLAGARAGAPAFAVWYHADITRQRRTGRLVAPLVRDCLRRAAGITVSSVALADRSPVLAPWRDKVRVVPFGIDPGPWARVQPDPEGPLLFVGRLVPYKGLRHLVDAVGGLPGARLEIVGDGPLRAELAARIADGGWADRIRLRGEVPDGDLPAAMARCRALVLPSLDRSETFGLILLEAMAAGLPAVTSRLDTGVAEVNEAGVTGWSAPPGDVGAWRRVLAEVLASPQEAHRRGEAGRRRVRERFAAAAMIGELVAWYRGISPVSAA